MTEQLAQVVTEQIAIDTIVELMAEKNRPIPENFGIDTVFTDIGLNSVELADVFMGLEDRVGARLDPDSAQQIRSVGNLLKLQALERTRDA